MAEHLETSARIRPLRRRQAWLLGSAVLCAGVLKSAMKGDPTLVVAVGASFLLHFSGILALEWRIRRRRGLPKTPEGGRP